MKIAIIYTGAMRSFDKCYRNHCWQIYRNFPEAKFYVLTEDDEDAYKSIAIIGARIKRVKQPQMVIPEGCPDTWTQGQPYMHEPYAISVHPHAVLGQLWMLREGWRLYQEANDPADLIIRIRPDIWFHSFEVPQSIKYHLKSTFILPLYVSEFPTIACTPWWGRFGGCNDRFALLGSKAAEAYFTTYDHIPVMIKEGAPLHPETLVYYSMKRAGISICDDMKAEFSTLRKTGEFREPEIRSVDFAHFRS